MELREKTIEAFDAIHEIVVNHLIETRGWAEPPSSTEAKPYKKNTLIN